MIYFTSDTHFWHKAIIQYCNRPWANPEEMNEGLISNWNSRVRPDDTVYHLGDFAFSGGGKAGAIFDRLHGFKHLIKGNHDNKQICKLPWHSVHDYRTLRPIEYVVEETGDLLKTPQIVLMHFPILSWENMHHGSWHLHGHCHGSLVPRGLRLDVGVDPSGLYPMSLVEIAAWMQMQVFEKVDHHG